MTVDIRLMEASYGPSHGENRGSIPLGSANLSDKSLSDLIFLCIFPNR